MIKIALNSIDIANFITESVTFMIDIIF
ncbi:hypothetical protein HQN84_05180 [Pedobacter steynii]|nr:hypothetical protein [Pedobacter steynii]